MAMNNGGYTLRPARESDLSAIRHLINQVGINPIGLHWERFVLAVDSLEEMIGCGQVKIHSDGSRELASIAVVERWRGKGVASKIIEHLIKAERGRLYLTCRLELGTFYQRFGFHQADLHQLPPYFRRLNRLVKLLRFLHLMPTEGVLILVWEKEPIV